MTTSSYYGPRGPYDTEAEASAANGYRVLDPQDYSEHNRKRLADAIAAAGVELGSYDRRILDWLAGWEPQTVEVIAALVERAAGVDRAVMPADPRER